MDLFDLDLLWTESSRDFLLPIVGWSSILAGAALAVRTVPRLLIRLLETIPAIKKCRDTANVRRIADGISSGELEVSFSFEDTDKVRHWTQLNFGAGTKTTYTIRPGDPDTQHDAVVGPLDTAAKET